MYWETVSKYELPFLDQANSSFDPSEILMLQFPLPRPSLHLSPFQPSFTLANRDLYSTQSWSYSSTISLFCPSPFDHAPLQIFDTPNHMPCKANQTYHQVIYRLWYFIGRRHYPSKSWVFKSCFSFKIRQQGQQQLYL